MASSCVPATSWEDAGAVIGPAEVRELLGRPHVLGLAEMMDVPAVLNGDPDVLAKLGAAHDLGWPVDGHAPSLDPLALGAYAAAGIRSCHESTTAAEARAKAALGMLVQVREGSPAQNLDDLLPLLASGEIDESWCLVTDDVFPNDLRRLGHLDGLLRRAVAGGVRPEVAVRHASFVPARHYGLKDRGAVAPGYRADLAVVDNLSDFHVRMVAKAGRMVAREGRYLAEHPPSRLVAENTVRIAPLDESAFRLPLSTSTQPVIRIVPDQIVTRFETMEVGLADGAWAFDPARDVVPIASIERHRASGRIGLGLVAGFGMTRRGAIGSSVAHDSHNLVIAGTDPRDMLALRPGPVRLGRRVRRGDRRRGPRPAAAPGRRPALDGDGRRGLPRARRGPRRRAGARLPARGAVRDVVVPGAAGDPRVPDHDARSVRRPGPAIPQRVRTFAGRFALARLRRGIHPTRGDGRIGPSAGNLEHFGCSTPQRSVEGVP